MSSARDEYAKARRARPVRVGLRDRIGTGVLIAASWSVSKEYRVLLHESIRLGLREMVKRRAGE